MCEEKSNKWTKSQSNQRLRRGCTGIASVERSGDATRSGSRQQCFDSISAASNHSLNFYSPSCGTASGSAHSLVQACFMSLFMPFSGDPFSFPHSFAACCCCRTSFSRTLPSLTLSPAVERSRQQPTPLSAVLTRACYPSTTCSKKAGALSFPSLATGARRDATNTTCLSASSEGNIALSPPSAYACVPDLCANYRLQS